MATLLLAAAGSGNAHDTWFAPHPAQSGSTLVLALSTGDKFPKQEFAVGAGFLARQGCRGPGSAKTRALKVKQRTDTALVLQTARLGLATCWARVSLPAALPGRWVLRGTELRPSTSASESWESRFVTLAFEVLPRAPAP